MKALYYFVFVLVIGLALILEATFFPGFRLVSAMPDLVLTIVISMTFFLPHKTALITAAVAGLLEDIYTGTMFGSSILALTIIVYLLATFSGLFIRENVITPLVVIFLGSVGYHLVMAAMLILMGQGYELGLHYMGIIVFGSVYNLLLGIVVYPMTYLAFHLMGGETR